MAGTLTISTLSDGTNSTSATNCIQGSAKAWVSFTGTTGAILASYNTSSITRASAGNYTVNFTNALTDANYAFAGFGSNSGGSGFTLRRASGTSSAFVFQAVDPNVAVNDSTVIALAFFR